MEKKLRWKPDKNDNRRTNLRGLTGPFFIEKNKIIVDKSKMWYNVTK